MGHRLRAFIGSASSLMSVAATLKLDEPRRLSPELVLLALADEFGGGQASEGEWAPPTAVLHLLAQHATAAPIAFVETEYFGGTGGQGAVVFKDGVPIYGPEWDEIGPINRALALLGVETSPLATDEFDTVGLGSLRSIAP